MIDKFEIEETPEVSIQKVDQAKIPNTMNVIMIIAVIIAALVSMGELRFTINDVVDFSFMAVLIYLITSMVYRNNYTAGMNRAMTLPAYEQAQAEYEKAKAQIYDKGMVSRLPELCMRYVEEDLIRCRTVILSDACIPYDLYVSEYLGKTKKELEDKGLAKSTISCIMRANKVKGLKLNSSMLLAGDSSSFLFRKMTLGISSSAKKNFDFGWNMVTRALTTTLTVMVGVEVVIEPSFKTLIPWVIKMIPVLWAALTSYNSGIQNINETYIPHTQKKTEIIKILIAWDEKCTQ